MICAGTGHRPDKISGGYSPEAEARLRNFAIEILRERWPSKGISGMALGWDLALADAAARNGIPFIAAIPFLGQESRWPEASQAHYRATLSKAAEVVVVCEGGYAAWKMQKRNCWMVDHCDLLLALWDRSKGGTESVSIEDVVGDISDLIGSPLVLAEEVSNADEYAAANAGQEFDDSHTWTFYRFATVKGTVTVRWLGTSNGYYSESVSYEINAPSVCS